MCLSTPPAEKKPRQAQHSRGGDGGGPWKVCKPVHTFDDMILDAEELRYYSTLHFFGDKEATCDRWKGIGVVLQHPPRCVLAFSLTDTWNFTRRYQSWVLCLGAHNRGRNRSNIASALA